MAVPLSRASTTLVGLRVDQVVGGVEAEPLGGVAAAVGELDRCAVRSGPPGDIHALAHGAHRSVGPELPRHPGAAAAVPDVERCAVLALAAGHVDAAAGGVAPDRDTHDRGRGGTGGARGSGGGPGAGRRRLVRGRRLLAAGGRGRGRGGGRAVLPAADTDDFGPPPEPPACPDVLWSGVFPAGDCLAEPSGDGDAESKAPGAPASCSAPPRTVPGVAPARATRFLPSSLPPVTRNGTATSSVPTMAAPASRLLWGRPGWAAVAVVAAVLPDRCLARAAQSCRARAGPGQGRPVVPLFHRRSHGAHRTCETWGGALRLHLRRLWQHPPPAPSTAGFSTGADGGPSGAVTECRSLRESIPLAISICPVIVTT
ncbi:hypothetical protein SAMN02787118_105474 [Streptomyces mirabilis]|uniref:Uncharacterized protein n=1 Tax=Streptomyces mirabilis TaxID=68239 RepID=A0A1I2HXU5_9ACTN|nr:hypothetical protein SAMN02787118_105474 [Streptomyces mirabilis]